jgi:hypothetical protein
VLLLGLSKVFLVLVFIRLLGLDDLLLALRGRGFGGGLFGGRGGCDVGHGAVNWVEELTGEGCGSRRMELTDEV